MPKRWTKVDSRPLTAKQERFAREYLVDLNAAAAARRAGFSARSAKKIASRLLRHPAVRQILDEHAAKAGAQLGLTVERLEEELARVAYLDPRKLRGDGGRILELHELDEDTARAVASVKHRTVKVIRGPKAAAAAKGLGIDPSSGGREVETLELGTVETRFHPKVEAIHLGLKRQGALVERHEVALEAGSDRELTREEYELLALLQHVVRPYLANPSATDARERLLQMLDKHEGPAHGQPTPPPGGITREVKG